MDTILKEQKIKLRKVSLDGLEQQKSKLRKVSLDDSGLDFSGFGHVEPVLFASGFRRRHSHVPLTESKRRATPKKVKYANFVLFFWTFC